MFTFKKSITASGEALVAALLVVVLLATSYFVLEPRISIASPVGSTFTVEQTILGEISFLVPPSNVGMVGSLSGITGGTANGSTTFVIRSNNATGYRVSIEFLGNGTPQAMRGINSLSEAIRDYPSVGGQPTFTFSTASTSAVFGYTVQAHDAGTLDQSFRTDGVSACNESAGSYTADRCWMEPMTTPFQIIDAVSAATAGATTTLHFRVHVPNNPTPGLVTDTYRATATLTAVNK